MLLTGVSNGDKWGVSLTCGQVNMARRFPLGPMQGVGGHYILYLAIVIFMGLGEANK